MASSTLDPEILAAHGELSLASRHFVEAIDRHPDWLRPIDYHAEGAGIVPSWMKDYDYPIQSWPTLIDAATVRELGAAAVGVSRLVKQAPTRVLGNDPEALARFYGGYESRMRLAIMLQPPNGIETAVGRCDLVRTADGFRCLEANLSARIGGWEQRFLEPVCGRNPRFAGFFAEESLTPRFRDPLRELFRSATENALRAGLVNEGAFHYSFLIAPEEAGWMAQAAPHFARVFEAVRSEVAPGLEGSVGFGVCPVDYEIRESKVFRKGGPRIHAIYEFIHSLDVGEIYGVFKSGNVQMYNGPATSLLCDKRNLALLSENASSGLFDDRERRIIESYVPWTRLLVERAVEYRGTSSGLRALLLAEPGRFVLKKARSAEGTDVVVGRFASEDRWRAALDHAFADGSWIVQEYAEPRPYLYQDGESGCAIHSAVWGAFCFGNSYGGGWLRLAPRQTTGDGVINRARGAVEGILYEV